MSRLIVRVSAVTLIALSVASQGCLVPWSKYIKLKREYERLVREVERKDGQLADDQTLISTYQGQIDSMKHIVGLYEQQKKEAEQLAAKTKEEVDELQRRLEEIVKGHGPDVEVIEDGLAIKGELLFPLGSAEVSEKGRELLQEIAAKFKATGEIIQVDGHTDDHRVVREETVKRFIDNWGLSAARASAVLRLLAKGGIPENRMYTRAFSMYKPRVPNTNEASRASNRRVEVRFRPPSMPKAAPPKKEG